MKSASAVIPQGVQTEYMAAISIRFWYRPSPAFLTLLNRFLHFLCRLDFKSLCTFMGCDLIKTALMHTTMTKLGGKAGVARPCGSPGGVYTQLQGAEAIFDASVSSMCRRIWAKAAPHWRWVGNKW